MDRYLAAVDRLGSGKMKLSFTVADAEHAITRRKVLSLWEQDAAFCGTFSRALADAPFEAFFWETPATTKSTLELPFECMLIAAPLLAHQPANPEPFAQHIESLQGQSEIVVFPNLGGDADLVVPSEVGPDVNYNHIAAFLRTAPQAQVSALWPKLSATAEIWLARNQAFWMSTAGLGVPWAHVRFDQRPKYYRHSPYKMT